MRDLRTVDGKIEEAGNREPEDAVRYETGNIYVYCISLHYYYYFSTHHSSTSKNLLF